MPSTMKPAQTSAIGLTTLDGGWRASRRSSQTTATASAT